MAPIHDEECQTHIKTGASYTEPGSMREAITGLIELILKNLLDAEKRRVLQNDTKTCIQIREEYASAVLGTTSE